MGAWRGKKWRWKPWRGEGRKTWRGEGSRGGERDEEKREAVGRRGKVAVERRGKPWRGEGWRGEGSRTPPRECCSYCFLRIAAERA
eukprot:scaffold267872_cov12-Tisochrysis_lutea.AAC.1